MTERLSDEELLVKTSDRRAPNGRQAVRWQTGSILLLPVICPARLGTHRVRALDPLGSGPGETYFT